jgi:hypothetical protein
MRDCQPAPVAFQRSMTSAGKRSEINLRGLGDTGLPPLALREAGRGKCCTSRELCKYAEICRVANVMRPYLESMT